MSLQYVLQDVLSLQYVLLQYVLQNVLIFLFRVCASVPVFSLFMYVSMCFFIPFLASRHFSYCHMSSSYSESV